MPIFIVTAFLLIPKEGHVSQIFHEEVGLDEVVRRSDLIIVAQPNGRTGS
jgi:hypothetical protein